jgi:broad specificity phosphatase PhoE
MVMKWMCLLRRLAALVLLGLAVPVAAASDDALWSLLKGGGQVVLIRHALTTPGVGDPPGMKLGDCASQRNLSEEGRREAHTLGKALRSHGVPVGTLLSSPWCRCLETARIVFGKEPQVHAALGNVFGRPELVVAQVEALKKLVAERAGRGNLFMVTHGSTTLALTDVSPATSEMVVLTPHQGGFRFAGRLVVR